MNTFTETKLTIKGEYELGATLTVPNGKTQKMPAVVIVSGTGKGDRDGNAPKMKLNLKIYKLLSDFMASQGFVTLRYDKRGVEESKGDYLHTSMNDLVDDIITNVKYLESLPYVDSKKIILMGHSEGCILTTIASQRYPVGGLILLSGAGICLKTAMMYQNVQSIRELQFSSGLKGFIARHLIKEEKMVAKIEKTFDKMKQSKQDVLRVQLVKLPAKWFREHLSYTNEDILKILSQTNIPVLAATGEKDVQVDCDDLKNVVSLGKPNITSSVIPSMDHMLREFKGVKDFLNIKKQYMGESEKPLNNALLELLASWLNDNITSTTKNAGVA